MASTQGPDLDGARVAVENLMDDACVITLDREPRKANEFDHETGKRIVPVPADDVIYDATAVGFEGRSLADEDATGGKCKVKSASDSSIPRDLYEGGGQIPVEFYVIGFPWDAPLPPKGSVIQITSSRRDPASVGQRFTVRAIAKVGTMLVSRKVLAELRGDPQ